jgi:hypothetical protein
MALRFGSGMRGMESDHQLKRDRMQWNEGDRSPTLLSDQGVGGAGLLEERRRVGTHTGLTGGTTPPTASGGVGGTSPPLEIFPEGYHPPAYIGGGGGDPPCLTHTGRRGFTGLPDVKSPFM